MPPEPILSLSNYAQVMVAQEVAKEREVLAGQGERREIQLQVSDQLSFNHIATGIGTSTSTGTGTCTGNDIATSTGTCTGNGIGTSTGITSIGTSTGTGTGTGIG